jgi:hypothetical protein
MSLTFEDLKTGKVRLIFGDMEQINCIRAYQKSLEDRDTFCSECDGEGVIMCPCCDGDGKRKKQKD